MLALLLTLIAQDAAAQTAVELDLTAPPPIQWELTLDTTARWQLDDGNVSDELDSNWDPVGEDFRDWTATLGGSIRWREFQASVQIDSAVYGNESVAADSASQFIKNQTENRYRDTVRLEYISGVYSKGKDSITLGDFYVTLGRGMVLAVRKVADVGIDNKLRGANFILNPVGKLTLQAFAGVLNIKNYETGTGYAYDEEDDFILGGRAAYSFGKYAKLGGHVMRYERFGDGPGRDTRTYGYGGTVELPRPVSWASFYFEGGGLSRNVIEQGVETETNGFGFYGSGNFYAGPITILLEGKYYDNLFQLLPGARITSSDGRQLINRLQEPPTAERPQAIILTNRSVGGGRARIDYRIDEHFTPFISGGRYRDFDGEVHADITTAFAGGTFHWSGGHATLNGGWRAEVQDLGDRPIGDQFDNSVLTQDWHWIADVSQEVVTGYTLELFGAGRHATELAGAQLCTEEDINSGACTVDDPVRRTDDGRIRANLTEWVEGRTALTFSSSDGWAVTGAWEFYTKSPDNFRPHYFSFAAQWEFYEGFIVRGLFGQERAGLKCSGGACRFFPGFEGGRLELNARL